MSERISQQELESYLWGAATLLRGLIDAGDYKQFIFPLLFFKRVSDVYDEEFQQSMLESGGDFAENHRFQIPTGFHWNDVRQTPKNVGMTIQTAMRAIEAANPDLLTGIFGDAPWTNKERLPDETLKDLVEHFSTQTLSVANVPEDELGNAYEFLIKKFADDSGHTAAEFYTNRTVVHLMTQLLDPQPGESIYDPTCGTGGMLLSALAEVKRSGGEFRTLKLYGQERNLITSGIARMSLFLHGIEDFQIVRGDTLAEPKLIEGDRLKQFDVILANPPYSIKQWDRPAFAADKWGRNFLGTPPQGRADYAFFQHILKSLTNKGRCAVLWPHGVLFRKEEQEIRAKMLSQDLVEAVIGLGPNLFYNSPMESCVVVCRRNKTKERKDKVLFIDALSAVTRERAQSFLKPEHQEHIIGAYRAFQDEAGFSKVATLEEIATNGSNLSIPLYVRRHEVTANANNDAQSLKSVWEHWQSGGSEFWKQMAGLVEKLDTAVSAESRLDNGKVHFIQTLRQAKTAQLNAEDAQLLKPVQPAFKRAVLAAEIVHQLHKEKRFGTVKLEKLLFLCEKHLRLEQDLQSNYLRQAAGPYDPKAMRSIISNLERHKWFKREKLEKKNIFIPMQKVGHHRIYYERYFSDTDAGIQEMIGLLQKMDTERCEIIATLYSAWSDFLSKGVHPTDDQVIQEVLHHWHESKQRISKERWGKGLGWMREHRLVPTEAVVISSTDTGGES